MEQPSSAIFYTQSDVWTAIKKLRRPSENIKVASPYIGDKVQFDWKAGDSLLIALSEANVRKGFVNPNALEELIDRGVKVYSNEKLHAKVYSNDEQAIICSCNLSYASQNEWLEAGIWISDTSNLEKVTLFFNDNMKGANLISKERLVQLQQLFGIDFNEFNEQVTASTLLENVWSVSLVDGETLPESLQKKIQIANKQTEKDKVNYSYYRFRTSNNDEFQVGDYIIRFKNVDGIMKIFFPARCIKISPITDNLFMIYLRNKGSFQPLEWEHLKSIFSDLDLSPIHSKVEQGAKVLERLYRYFNIL
jgi:hypothetical protein